MRGVSESIDAAFDSSSLRADQDSRACATTSLEDEGGYRTRRISAARGNGRDAPQRLDVVVKSVPRVTSAPRTRVSMTPPAAASLPDLWHRLPSLGRSHRTPPPSQYSNDFAVSFGILCATQCSSREWDGAYRARPRSLIASCHRSGQFALLCACGDLQRDNCRSRTHCGATRDVEERCAQCHKLSVGRAVCSGMPRGPSEILWSPRRFWTKTGG